MPQLFGPVNRAILGSVKIIRALAVYAALCVLFVHVAFADVVAVATTSATLTIFDDVVHVVGSALAIALMGLATLAVQKLAQKWHLQVPQEWLSKINDSIDHGIAYAEEQAQKHASSSSVLSSGTKLDMAAQYVLNIVGDDKKLVGLGDAKLKQMIEARLNLSRSSTTAALATEAASAPAASAPPKADPSPMPAAGSGITSAVLVPMLAILMFGGLMFGCGAAAREKAINTSTSAAAAVDVMFLAYDQQRLHTCVVDNTTRDGHDACVTAYLAKRKKVDDAITALRDAVELGKAAKDDGALVKIAAAAFAFEQSINSLKEDVK